MKRIVLGLGGNEGDVIKTLSKTIILLGDKIGDIDIISSLYQTQAWGVENQPDFINMVVVLKTDQVPIQVLNNCLQIEKQIGRIREGSKKWAERIVDIDILFYEDEIIKLPNLRIPHQYLHERNFVLYPLVEILPFFSHPELKKTMLELKNETIDEQKVNLLNDVIY